MLKERIEKQKLWGRIRWYLLSGGFLLFVILFFSLLVNWQFLRIREFEVRGSRRVSEVEVIDELKSKKISNVFAKYLGFTNILFWNDGVRQLKNPIIGSANVTSSFWDRKVTVQVIERRGELIWCVRSERCFWLDERGIAIEEAPFSEGQLLPIVYSRGEGDVNLGTLPIDEIYFLRVKKILKIISLAGVPLKNLDIYPELLEAKAYAVKGPFMIFNLRIDPSFAEAPLGHLYKNLGFSKLNYIDFSIENKVFYK